MTENRAVTVPLQYVILLATISLLSAGLFVSVGGFVQAERTTAVEDTLEVIGTRLSVDLAAADRLAGPLDGSGNVSVAVELPTRIAGAAYTISVESGPGNRSQLVLETTHHATAASVTLATDVPIEPTTVPGGPVVVRYAPGADRLEVRHA